ncbi:hypothetical protein FACS189432_01150 [Bacteroidia bacterium]|nr:hypothetical protein FACS189426_03410 [Bacteroidia bacterium]GHT26537.1 hypothetical protein FACS189432_01150 [Bacteroidia bacterium]GHV71086.1 hypothetical protein FACS189420_4830 [Bacteroidia bacterium]
MFFRIKKHLVINFKIKTEESLYIAVNQINKILDNGLPSLVLSQRGTRRRMETSTDNR